MLTQKRICELVTGESRSPMRFEIRAIGAVKERLPAALPAIALGLQSRHVCSG